jgi:hypothetical protein
MCRDDLGLRRQILLSRVSKRPRLARWQLVWLVALVAAGMAAGVSVAGGDPDWEGTEPENISSGMSRAWQSVVAAGPPGRIVVAWSGQESAEAPWNIYARRSDDNGHTWSVRRVISETAYESALPDACTVGDRVFVTWVDQKTVGGENVVIYEAEVGTEGARFIPSSIPLSSTQPRLAAGTDRLHVVFNAGASILHAMRPLTATAWPTAMGVHTSTAALGPWFPALAAGPDGETLHVVWQERGFGEWTIMYMRGKANGAEIDWEPARILSLRATEVFYPDIAADSAGNLHIVWGEAFGTGGLAQRGQYVRYTRCNAAGGECLSPAIRIDDEPVRVNQDNPTYTAPCLALLEREDQAKVCVAWHGFREGGFSEDVLLSCSLDRGESWSAPQNVSRGTDAEGISIAPSIAFDASGQLHSVWQEHTADMGPSVVYDYQVFYSRAVLRVFMPIVARHG